MVIALGRLLVLSLALELSGVNVVVRIRSLRGGRRWINRAKHFAPPSYIYLHTASEVTSSESPQPRLDPRARPQHIYSLRLTYNPRPDQIEIQDDTFLLRILLCILIAAHLRSRTRSKDHTINTCRTFSSILSVSRRATVRGSLRRTNKHGIQTNVRQ